MSRSAITPSTGDRPERQESATADILSVTLDPGAVIPLSRAADRQAAKLDMWEPDADKDKVNSFTISWPS